MSLICISATSPLLNGRYEYLMGFIFDAVITFLGAIYSWFNDINLNKQKKVRTFLYLENMQ